MKIGLKNETEVAGAYDEILSSIHKNCPDAKIDGVSVQSMARPGTEIIIGMFKDAQFGPVLMFGLGGILVEVLKDVCFRVVPLTARDAREMIKEIKGYTLLKGYRGYEPADIPYLEGLLLRDLRFLREDAGSERNRPEPHLRLQGRGGDRRCQNGPGKRLGPMADHEMFTGKTKLNE